MYSMVMVYIQPSIPNLALWPDFKAFFSSTYVVFNIIKGYHRKDFFENMASEQGIWKKWTDTENSDQ